MEVDISMQKIKESIIENALIYFDTTGESISDEFLLLLVDSLVDEYKVKRNYPGYFTEEQVDADVSAYFKRKKSYFSMKVIPAMVGKIGAEGLSSLSDNGISKVFESDTYFSDVIPYCEVL